MYQRDEINLFISGLSAFGTSICLFKYLMQTTSSFCYIFIIKPNMIIFMLYTFKTSYFYTWTLADSLTDVSFIAQLSKTEWWSIIKFQPSSITRAIPIYFCIFHKHVFCGVALELRCWSVSHVYQEHNDLHNTNKYLWGMRWVTIQISLCTHAVWSPFLSPWRNIGHYRQVPKEQIRQDDAPLLFVYAQKILFHMVWHMF